MFIDENKQNNNLEQVERVSRTRNKKTQYIAYLRTGQSEIMWHARPGPAVTKKAGYMKTL